MGRARYTLLTDISYCYGSIYTHSLEWALDTKAASKARLGTKGPKSVGAQLDAAVRGGQDGQTKGIPIGPDTSLLLSEILLCAIDGQLAKEYPRVATSGLRFMDDFEFYASSRAEAEEVLMYYDSLLASYDLALNPTKTRLVEGLIPVEQPWRTRLSQCRLRSRSDSVYSNDLLSLFSVAVELATAYPGQPVLSYAIQRVRPRPTGIKSWKTFQDLLRATATAEPSSLRFVSSTLAWAQRAGLAIERELLTETLNELCHFHAPFEHGSEVTWALALLRELGLSITTQAAARVARMQDNSALLLLLDMYHAKRIDGAELDISSIVSRAEDELAWKSSDWLLGYEAGYNKWSSLEHYEQQPHWAELQKLGVRFFNPGRIGAPGTIADGAPANSADVPEDTVSGTAGGEYPG